MVNISTWRSRIGSFLQKAKNCLTIKGINKLGISYSYIISLVVSVHFLIDSNETKKASTNWDLGLSISLAAVL